MKRSSSCPHLFHPANPNQRKTRVVPLSEKDLDPKSVMKKINDFKTRFEAPAKFEKSVKRIGSFIYEEQYSQLPKNICNIMSKEEFLENYCLVLFSSQQSDSVLSSEAKILKEIFSLLFEKGIREQKNGKCVIS